MSFTASVVLVNFTTAAPTYRYCELWQFRCRNGKCINKNRLCNNYNDCGDQSDEHHSVCRGNVVGIEIRNTVIVYNVFITTMINDYANKARFAENSHLKAWFSLAT